jgi:hypothetical protein
MVGGLRRRVRPLNIPTCLRRTPPTWYVCMRQVVGWYDVYGVYGLYGLYGLFALVYFCVFFGSSTKISNITGLITVGARSHVRFFFNSLFDIAMADQNANPFDVSIFDRCG